jgi:hypothetical protein
MEKNLRTDDTSVEPVIPQTKKWKETVFENKVHFCSDCTSEHALNTGFRFCIYHNAKDVAKELGPVATPVFCEKCFIEVVNTLASNPKLKRTNMIFAAARAKHCKGL